MHQIILISLLSFTLNCYSQTFEWEMVENHLGVSRDDGVAFAIKDNIYYGSGNHGGFLQSNIFHKYNILTATWSLSAVFPGVRRQYARASVIAGKGYLYGGIDLNSIPLNDLWEYDPLTDSWTELAELPAAPRWQAASFVLNEELYYGTGRDWTIIYNDFWKYNPTNDAWEQLSSLPKTPCYETVSFALYDKGYLGVGRDCTGVFLTDFWRYNPRTDEWVQTEDFPADARYYAKAESYGGYGIVGSGQNQFSEMLNDFYAYDPIKENWTQLPSLPISNRRGMASAAIPFKGAFFIGGLDESFNRSKGVFRLSIKNEIEASFKLVYNGTQKIIYISEIDSVGQINIFSTDGRAVYETELSDTQHFINTSDWTPGTYLVRINGKVKKIIVI